MLPAVTTSVQSTYLTGKWPSDHGVVGNGWYDRLYSEVLFWKQSNKLVLSDKIWDAAKKINPEFTCANLFWWYNMHSTVDYAVTPRPNYLADGRKMPDCYTSPPELRDKLQTDLGQFPLFKFWGPGADINSSKWIADAAIITDETYNPTLSLVYLPHLDYCLQKFGNAIDKYKTDLTDLDNEVKKLVEHFERKKSKIIILSEYGIAPVDKPIHINRILRANGYLKVRIERGLEILDTGTSTAFAVSDHQVTHIYINQPAVKDDVLELLKQVPGIKLILDKDGQRKNHIAHQRAGDFVCMADNDYWFTYYYWLDDNKAPDFARSVDIFKKPGYDPAELFMTSKMRAAYKLLRKKVGLRYVMDVIPLDASLIKGSHGNISANRSYHPVFITSDDSTSNEKDLKPTDIYQIILNSVFPE